ncbi:hypothetical protein SLE2022_177630 [Rubroshorea leprosula]
MGNRALKVSKSERISERNTEVGLTATLQLLDELDSLCGVLFNYYLVDELIPTPHNNPKALLENFKLHPHSL